MAIKNRAPSTGVFRSESMYLCNIILQSNVAFDVTCSLGDLGIVEFRDLNAGLNAYQRKYVDEIHRINDIQRRLVYLNEQVLKEDVEIHFPSTEPNVPRYKEILHMETSIQELEQNLREVNERLYSLQLKQLEYLETSEVFSKTSAILNFGRKEKRRHSSFLGMEFLRSDEETAGNAAAQFHKAHGRENDKLHTVTGVVDANKTNSFHKMIWRICGNNAFVQFYDIEMPINDVKVEEQVKKKVLLVICQGEQLYTKVRKICEGFRATLYPVPDNEQDYREMSMRVDVNLQDIQVVIDHTLKQRHQILLGIAHKDNLRTWTVQLTKLRAVFSTMNLFRKTEKGFLAECWCAKSDYALLQSTVNDVVARSGVQGQAVVQKMIPTETPPTYFRTNKFTQGFQNIVDSYGVANYGEVNPAPYTIITFPFLFAVMFADAGHGFIMLLFALWLVLFEKKLTGKSNNEIWLTFFDGRYIILLMGAFSIYTGFIYNDVFAKSMNIFGTAFNIPEPPLVPYHPPNSTLSSTVDPLVPQFVENLYLTKSDDVYPFGVDAVWQLSENKILFLNSFKMKLSVILGVMQMFFGVSLSLFNHFHFRHWLSMFFEFIPQVVFLLSLFGYMIGLIFTKWLMKFTNPSEAPSILIDFINMFLFKYPEEPVYLKPWFDHKKDIQVILLVLALSCVPLMLLVKPIITICCKPKKRVEVDEESTSVAPSSHDEEEESAGDIFIHQAIHTIEYCLGSISHTASYLRLWALSLAHSQLSEVLWNMVMRAGFASDSKSVYMRCAITYFAFAFWAILTVAILIVMEGLSAFLHALRLHWVEFQSKFYIGNGYSFKPFKFSTILSEVNILAE